MKTNQFSIIPLFGLLLCAAVLRAPAQTTDDTSQRVVREYINRANEKRKNGDLTGAIADYTEAIRLDPKNARAYRNRGFAKEKNGDLAGAMADYTEAIRFDPKDTLAYCDRGVVKAKNGDLAGAMADYKEAIRLDPKYALAYRLRGAAITNSGDRNGAIADYTEAIRLYAERISLHPDDFAAYAGRADAKDQLGDKSGAAQDRASSATIQEQVAFAKFQKEVTKASLSDLLASSDKTESIARERNLAIVAAKNQQLPAILRDRKTDELSALVVKIEQTILELNHECEVAKDRAQQATATNGDPRQIEELRGLTISYRERIELLKPILTALKEEIANRNR